MSKTKIMEWFSGNSSVLTSEKILLYLFLALLVAIIIYITYRITYTGVCYNNKFAVANVIIVLIATVLMMMISSNIVISLGMVGALSIVRYRTAIKDPGDTLFLFWSIVEGLCVGAQMFKMAFISTLFIAIVVIAATYIGCTRKKYLLIVRGTKDVSIDEILTCINGYYSKNRVRTLSNSETGFETIIEITSKEVMCQEMMDGVKKSAGVKSVNWLLQTGESIG